MEHDWILTKSKLPEAGFDAVLVLVHGSSLPAIAVYVGKGNWKVQPLFADWYVADNDKVAYWKPISTLTRWKG